MLLLGRPNCLWQRCLPCHPRWRTGGDREDPVGRRGPAQAERSAGRGRLAGVSPLSRSVVHHQLVVARLFEVAGRQSTRSDVHLIVETECWPTPMASEAAWWPRLIPLGPVQSLLDQLPLEIDFSLAQLCQLLRRLQFQLCLSAAD